MHRWYTDLKGAASGIVVVVIVGNNAIMQEKMHDVDVCILMPRVSRIVMAGPSVAGLYRLTTWRVTLPGRIKSGAENVSLYSVLLVVVVGQSTVCRDCYFCIQGPLWHFGWLCPLLFFLLRCLLRVLLFRSLIILTVVFLPLLRLLRLVASRIHPHLQPNT